MMSVSQNSRLKGVLRGRKAYKTFRYAAWCMLPLALIFLVALTPMHDITPANRPAQIAFQILSACIGVLGAVAGIVIFIRLTDLLLVNRTSRKLVWLIVFLLTACFGSGIYFFVVYRKQVAAPSADLRMA